MDRIAKGEEPASLPPAPSEARFFGDLADPNSKVSQLIAHGMVINCCPNWVLTLRSTICCIGGHNGTGTVWGRHRLVLVSSPGGGSLPVAYGAGCSAPNIVHSSSRACFSAPARGDWLALAVARFGESAARYLGFLRPQSSMISVGIVIISVFIVLSGIHLLSLVFKPLN